MYKSRNTNFKLGLPVVKCEFLVLNVNSQDLNHVNHSEVLNVNSGSNVNLEDLNVTFRGLECEFRSLECDIFAVLNVKIQKP